MPVLMWLGVRLGALDNTREPPVPRVGGWALILGSAAALTLVGGFFGPTGATLLAMSKSVGPVTLGAFAILLAGSVDDIHPLPASVKFVIQILVSAAVYSLGVRIEVVSYPFGSLELGPLIGAVFTILWLVGVSNAFNLLDGADGIASGSAFFAATAVFIMSVILGHPAIGLVAAALAGAFLGFLPFNFPPARAFLGDSGSMFTGFLLAGLAVEGSTKGPTMVAIAVPVVAFGVPLFDTTITLIRRLVRGRPIFERDQEHLHHRLLSAGFSPRQVAGVLYTASAAFALAAMLFINPGVRSVGVVLIVLGVAFWMAVRYLRLHEINELARLARRGALQPRSIAMNVQLRRAAERLEGVKNLEDLQDALAILFHGSEFDQVALSVTPGDERRGASQSWCLEDGAFRPGCPERLADEWEVVCPFEGTNWTGELKLRRRLGRRSLLLDLNLLLEIVQPALGWAARRIEMALPRTS
jgi:UDP-GlcNAc:undecaprenyl-phosphate GlcNAc-1-phosphate transferase